MGRLIGVFRHPAQTRVANAVQLGTAPVLHQQLSQSSEEKKWQHLCNFVIFFTTI